MNIFFIKWKTSILQKKEIWKTIQTNKFQGIKICSCQKVILSSNNMKQKVNWWKKIVWEIYGPIRTKGWALIKVFKNAKNVSNNIGMWLQINKAKVWILDVIRGTQGAIKIFRWYRVLIKICLKHLKMMECSNYQTISILLIFVKIQRVQFIRIVN